MYKKGTRNRIYSKTLVNKLKNEFSMTFKLKKISEINEIQIGIVNFWSNYQDCHL